MYLVFDPAFGRYCAIFGDAPVSVDGQFYFESRAEAQHAARSCGLRINNRNRFVVA